MTSMLECEQYVNVVRLIVPSAEITAEMHRRAQEAAQAAGQKPVPDAQENELDERCPHDPACKVKCREKTNDERKKSSNYFKGNNLHEPHKRERVHEGHSSDRPYQRLHSKEKITYDAQGQRHHVRERPSKNYYLHQSEVRDYPESHMQVRIDAPDTVLKISEPCSKVLQQRLSLLHISRSKTSREGPASPEWPVEVGKKSSWCRSPSPISGNTGYDQYQKSLLEVPWCIDYGDASSDDLSSEWDSDVPEPPPPLHPKLVESQILLITSLTKIFCGKFGNFLQTSGWRKLRNIVQWTPFFQTYKKQRYPWVQLAGHQGNFRSGPDQGTILKKLCSKEETCFQALMKDTMRPFVPEYKGQIQSDDGDSAYLQLQDLLSGFDSPCVMDCKVGVRTYLEEELAKAKENPKLRKDMYEKMIQIDPLAPTEEEHRLKGVTKPRYMVWRETISSTATLGFRIEGIKKADGTSTKDFKTTKTEDQILEAFRDFTRGLPNIVKGYIARLKQIKHSMADSEFIKSHEIIGSSLLFVHDKRKVSIWLIDFAKTVPLPENVRINHSTKWTVGNHEDGFMIGLDNLISIFTTISEDMEKEASEQNISHLVENPDKPPKNDYLPKDLDET